MSTNHLTMGTLSLSSLGATCGLERMTPDSEVVVSQITVTSEWATTRSEPKIHDVHCIQGALKSLCTCVTKLRLLLQPVCFGHGLFSASAVVFERPVIRLTLRNNTPNTI